MAESASELLTAIAAEVRTCSACPLHATRTHAVPGEGAADATFALIGEAPGGEEDRQGRPFVGRSGQFLRHTIREVGWREEEVFIPGLSRPLNLDRKRKGLQLLQAARDEAHRFAIEYNRLLRRKKVVRE